MESTEWMWHADGQDEKERLCSENECLALIDRYFPSASEHFPQGRGHDCAELAGLPGSLALSTDMFWQDVHFRTRYFTPAEAGAKALSSAVSDLAAAGTIPLGFSLGLLLPPQISIKTLSGVFAGMAAKAADFGIVLTGGDLSLADRIGFSICVWGKSPVRDGAFLRRGRALPGDCLFIAGNSGLARTGLWVLEKHGRAAVREWPEACAALLCPEPLLEAGQKFSGLAHAHKGMAERCGLMDLSDGPARDIPRLLDGLGAELEIAPDLLHQEVRRASLLMGYGPEEVFLLGGEDYSLLGTCPEPLWPEVSELVPGARHLGRVVQEQGVFIKGKRFRPEGFDHFSSTPVPAASPQEKNHHEDYLSLPSPRAVQASSGQIRAGASQSVGRTLEILIRLGKEAWQAGLMAGFNGNISARLEDPDAFLVTRSGAAKGRLEEQDFLLLSLPEGEKLQGFLRPSPTGPSSESPMHLEIYKACPDSRAVLHTHPPALLALSLALAPEERLKLPLPEAECYRSRLVQTPFMPPGSAELAVVVAQAATKGPAVWLERHGLMVHGADPVQLLALTEELEQLALVHLRLLQTKNIAGLA